MRMRMPFPPWKVLFLVAIALLVHLGRPTPPLEAQTAAAPPTLTFSPQTVQVQGMTPGGTVVWFGMGLDVVEYSAMRSERQETAVADAQGGATLAFPSAVPPQSVWVAVDLATGAFALGSPPAFTPGRFNLAAGAIFSGTGSASDQLADPADCVHVLLVRPGQGAWAATIGRGGVNDQSSPTDASLRFSIESLVPLTPGAAAAPARLGAKDLLFVARPRTLEIGTATVN
jgi:hypothetical protein